MSANSNLSNNMITASIINYFGATHIVIDPELRIVNTTGEATKYLNFPSNGAIFDIISTIKERLRLELRVAVSKCKKELRPVVSAKVMVLPNDEKEEKNVSLVTIPVLNNGHLEHIVIVFQEESYRKNLEDKVVPSDLDNSVENKVFALEHELGSMREQLQTIIEELETSNEELQATNEELQSTNKELEINNEALNFKAIALQELADEIENTFNILDFGIIILDTKLIIKRFSHKAGLLFDISSSSIGCVITSLRHRFNLPTLYSDINKCLNDRVVMSSNVKDHAQEFLVDIYPLFSERNTIEGVILTVYDVTRSIVVEHERKRFESLLAFSPDGVHILDLKGNLLQFSNSFAQMLGYNNEEMSNKHVTEWDINLSPTEFKQKLGFMSSERITFQSVFKRKDDSLLDVEITAKIIEIEGERYVYASARDISEAKQLKDRLIKERNFVSSLVDHANAIIAVIEPDGRMISLNHYGQSYTGCSQEEVASEPYFWIRFIDDHAKDDVIHLFENAVQHGNVTRNFRNSWRAKDGSAQMFEWSNSLILKADGSVDYLLTIGLNIHAKLEAQRKVLAQKIEFESIFNLSRDGIVIIDLSFKLLDFNRAFVNMMGYEREELLALSCLDLTDPNDRDRIAEMFNHVSEGLVVDNFEQSCLKKDGQCLYMTISAILMPDKQRILVSTKDLSIQKENEERLKRAIIVAEKADKAKSAFLANMSHEIRTPLNGIIGLNTLLLNTDPTPLQADYITKSLYSSKVLLGVLNDILDFSKIEAGKLDLSIHPFILEDVLQATASLFEYAVLQKELELHVYYDSAIPYMLEGDALRIGQILNNLVGNAVKFTDKGDITISVKLLKIKGKKVELGFEVKDTGIGIDSDNQQKLFRSFSQMDNANNRKYGGTGLGLVICKQLIAMMGGHIGVDSVKGEGANFYFNLHLHKAHHEPLPQPAIDKLKPARFLVVEDNAIERQIIGDIFKSWGLTPVLCDSAEAALELVQTQYFDYLLLDWRLPNMDGLDLLARIQEIYTTQHPRVIMFSALMRDGVLQKAHNKHLYPDVVLHKPLTSTMLLRALLDDPMNLDQEHHTHQEDSMSHFKGRVLMVEDNELNQVVGHDLLVGLGLEVDVADNGSIGVQKVYDNNYDLILMDLQMPVMDGFEASKRIRAFNTTVPIVALSAAVMQHDKALTREAGMNDHIAKPIDMMELKEILSHYLSATVGNDDSEDSTDIAVIDGIDMAHLKKMFKHEERILSYLQIFANTQRGFCNKFRRTELGDDVFKRMVHSLKGVAGNIAATRLYALVQETEIASEKHQDVALQPLSDALCHELERLLAAVDAHISGNQVAENETESDHPTLSIDTVHGVLNDLLVMLTNRAWIDDQQMKRVIQACKPYTTAELLRTLQIAIQSFDFVTAIHLVEQLNNHLRQLD